jgi:flavin reductase (DIM6/NTAB) family NADH-FMN oxidoreductase RutF
MVRMNHEPGLVDAIAVSGLRSRLRSEPHRTSGKPTIVSPSTIRPDLVSIDQDGYVRTDFDPAQLSIRAFYKLMTALVVPRPIAWVSTRSADGVVNLAPHSFFTVACTDPPVVQFTSVGRKDSLDNVEATGEFVVNLATEALFEQVNATATDFPADVDEFAAVGLTPEPSLRVAPPRVAGSPAALECVLHATTSFGNCTVVFGRVVHAVVDTAALDGDHPRIEALAPLSRLGRDEWGTAGDVREITRIPFRDWPGHYRGASE